MDWKIPLILLGIGLAYYFICLALFYWHEWIEHRYLSQYDDYNDRAG